jgi:hypothetical protein
MSYLLVVAILLSGVITLAILSSPGKREKLKTPNKGLSAEEMGTAHKNKKSRRERKRK